MGREIKRVEANFDWPLDKDWKGYLRPKHLHSKNCPHCLGTGVNEQTKQIQDDFYDSNNFGVTWSYDYKTGVDGKPAEKGPWLVLGETKRWCHSITQEEVDYLIAEGRLYQFKDKNPTAEQINHWNLYSPMGHDAINRYLLTSFRAKKLGVYGLCEVCDGEGCYYDSKELKAESEAWEPTEVPQGDWWQVWQTVSDGAPVTPAFATAEELIDYLVEKGDIWDQKRGDGGWSREVATNFVNTGWAPSLIIKTNEEESVLLTPREGA